MKILLHRENNQNFHLKKNLQFRFENKQNFELTYTYSKMKEDLGDFSAAFENYVAGGALRQKAMSYDQMRDKRLFMKIKNATLKLKDFPLHPSVKETDVTPIFILLKKRYLFLDIFL